MSYKETLFIKPNAWLRKTKYTSLNTFFFLRTMYFILPEQATKG